MEIIVGIGEYAVTDHQADTIKTYALASCVAVTAYCPAKKAGGMVHVVLPFSANGEAPASKPGYYAVTGVPALINTLCTGYDCLRSGLRIQVFGGADSVNDLDIFRIGRKNIKAVEEVLKSMNLSVQGRQVGGTISRTVELDIASGEVKLAIQPIII